MDKLWHAVIPFARMAMLYTDHEGMTRCAGCDGHPFQADEDQPFHPDYLYSNVVGGVTFVHGATCPVMKLREVLMETQV